MAKVTMSFSLDDQEDRAILRELEALPKGARSRAIREALGRYYGQGRITLGDVYQKLTDLERSLEAGAAPRRRAPRGKADAPQEPPEAAAALDELGL